jgi:hypothetical protein
MSEVPETHATEEQYPMGIPMYFTDSLNSSCSAKSFLARGEEKV